MFFKDKNILVTGASGFVGTNLITKLIGDGANVRGTLHKRSPQVDFPSDKISYIYGDLTDKKDCKNAVEGIDYVFMCAANTSGAAVMEKTPLVHVTPNVIMNSLMLESSYEARVKKFMFLSSNTVYPLSDIPLKEEDVTGEFFHKYFFVANMKKFTEILCEMYGSKIENKMTTIIIRPGNLYGPYDDFEWETSHSTPALIRRVVERHNPIEVWGDGSDKKDLLYIDDFIRGIMLAMENVNKFDIFNIASGRAFSIKETLEMILKIDKYENSNVVFDTTKPIMISKRLINIAKSIKLLGFDPKISLREGVEKTINWYREKI